MLFYIQIPKKPPEPATEQPLSEAVSPLEQAQRQRHHRAEASQLRQTVREAYALERRFML